MYVLIYQYYEVGELWSEEFKDIETLLAFVNERFEVIVICYTFCSDQQISIVPVRNDMRYEVAHN